MSEKIKNQIIAADDPMMTTKQLAVYSGMSEAFHTKGRIEGRRVKGCPPVPFIRIGRAVRYRKSDVDAWLLKNRCAMEDQS
jgi:hypothetical protein